MGGPPGPPIFMRNLDLRLPRLSGFDGCAAARQVVSWSGWNGLRFPLSASSRPRGVFGGSPSELAAVESETNRTICKKMQEFDSDLDSSLIAVFNRLQDSCIQPSGFHHRCLPALLERANFRRCAYATGSRFDGSEKLVRSLSNLFMPNWDLVTIYY